MKITPRRCLRNGVIILIIFGLLSCFKVLWRPKVTTVIRKPPSRLQWVQGQPTRNPATQIDYPTHTTETNDSSTSLLDKSRILILVYTKFWNEERWVGELRGKCFLDYETQCPLEKFKGDVRQKAVCGERFGDFSRRCGKHAKFKAPKIIIKEQDIFAAMGLSEYGKSHVNA